MSEQFYLPEYLDGLEEILVAGGHDVERDGLGLRIPREDGAPHHEISTVVHSNSAHRTASLLLRTFPAEHEVRRESEDSPQLARMPVLAGIVNTPYGPFIGTRFTILCDLAPEWHVVELIYTAIQFNARFASVSAENPVKEAYTDARWTEREFELVAKTLGRHVKAKAEGKTLSLQIPLGGGLEATFTLTACSHPLIGSGLLSVLTVPYSSRQSLQHEIESRLNLLEFEPRPTGPPCLGVWRVRIGSPSTYTTFVPACIEADYILYYLSKWAMERAHECGYSFIAAMRGLDRRSRN